MKKLLALVLALAMVLSLAACGSQMTEDPATTDEPTVTEAPAFKFERDIELLLCVGEGGGVDTTFRSLIPYLEQELGVNIIPNNISGASGMNGMEYLAKQEADGYTFVAVNPSPLGAALQGNCSWDLVNDLELVANVVWDTDVILVSKDSPYNTFEEFVEYCKANPGKASFAVSTLKGIDGAAVGNLCDEAGIDLNYVVYSGSEPLVALISGEIDASVATYTDAGAYIESGDLKPLCVLCEERVSVLPDVPCTVELGYNATLGPWRGMACMTGTPQEAIDAMAAAIEKVCTTNPDWQKWLELNGLQSRPGFMNSEEFSKVWADYAVIMTDIFAKMDAEG